MRSLGKWFSLAAIVGSISTIVACSGPDEQVNSLNQDEKKFGWQLLFDGETLNGWHGYNNAGGATSWSVVGGELYCNPHAKNHMDLATDSVYENFDLKFEWRVAKGGNSGVFINVQEQPDYAVAYLTGPEYQLLDNINAEPRHVSNPTHQAGCLYDILNCKTTSKPKPYNEWNSSRILQNNGEVTFWLNDVMTAKFNLKGKNWESTLKNTNLGKLPGFGRHSSGKIVLQDHTDEVAFRSIKIKRL